MLRIGWGNLASSGSDSYIAAVVREARDAQGAVLECGSGLTTVVLSLYAGRRGVEVIALEHMLEWRLATKRAIQRVGGERTTVALAPLVSYGDFDWYEADAVPDNVGLVVCDGPPGEITAGGRYGLMPVVGLRLAPGCVVLLDDAERATEASVLERWRSEFGLTDVEVVTLGRRWYARAQTPR
jgi:hypothetical protein